MTVESSSSSEAVGAETKAPDVAPDPATEGDRAPEAAADLPLIEFHNVGIWFRLHSKKSTLRRAVIGGLHSKLSGGTKKRVLWALRNISLQFYEGQSIGIVGHNGAGKSTLCLALAQILTPDEGKAIIRGKVSPLLTLGAGFNNDISGRANILLHAAFLGIPRDVINAKIREIIEFSELGDFIDEPVRTYSRGMRTRLGFAVATELDPDILILDEVLAVGDQQFRAKSGARMQQMMEQSRLIVIVSHSTLLLRQICSHALWLDHGEMKQFGEADEVLTAYDAEMGGVDPLGEVDFE